jgi:hypothetical protein
MAHLVDGLRERGALITFTTFADVQDVERHAVVWFAGGRFLVPHVRWGPDGELIEMRPVKSVAPSSLRLSFALIDRLLETVKPAGPKDRVAHPAHLAEVAKIDLEAFEREARRILIHGSREAWELRLDGMAGVWTAPRKTDENALADAILELVRGNEPAGPDEPARVEETSRVES